MPPVVYSAPGCYRCKATVREFKKFGINPEVIDISTDSEARAYVMSLGHQSLPVVVAGDQIWSEHQPTRIKALAA